MYPSSLLLLLSLSFFSAFLFRGSSSKKISPSLDPCAIADLPSLTNFDFYARDFGEFIHNIPRCVFKVESEEDVRKVVLFGKSAGVQISVRGAGHGAEGQAQCEDGIVIDTSDLTALTINADTVTAGVGLIFKDVILPLATAGKTLKVYPDAAADLSVGGVTSIGGGGRMFTQGAVVDTVTKMRVVTGKGEIQDVSATKSPSLFRAILGGIGQFAVIVSVTFQTINITTLTSGPVVTNSICATPPSLPPGNVYTHWGYTFVFSDASEYYDAIKASTNPDNGFDSQDGSVVYLNTIVATFSGITPDILACFSAVGIDTTAIASPVYLLTLYDKAGTPSPTATFLNSLAGTSGRLITILPYDTTTLVFLASAAAFKQTESYYTPKTVFSPFIPESAVSKALWLNFAQVTFKNLATAGVPMFISAHMRKVSVFNPANSFMLPRTTEYYFSPSIIFLSGSTVNPQTCQVDPTNPVPGGNPLNHWQMGYNLRQLTSQLYTQTLQVVPDTKVYPFGQIPYTWQQHYGSTKFNALRAIKKDSDPHDLLGCGIDIPW